MLGIVEHRQRNADMPRQRIDEAVDRAGAGAGDRHFLAVVDDRRLDDAAALLLGIREGLVVEEFQPRAGLVDIDFEKAVIDALRRHLLAFRVGDRLDVAG